MKILVRKSSFKIYEFQKLKTLFLLKQQEQVPPQPHTNSQGHGDLFFYEFAITENPPPPTLPSCESAKSRISGTIKLL